MSYTCYLGGVEMPTPSKLTVKVKNKNKTQILLNEGEINFLRAAGLTEITVPFVFPMLASDRPPSYYLGHLEELKTSRKPTQFILVRRSPDGKSLFDTNIKVSIEDYSITEDAKNGLDVSVDVNLKQWRNYSTKVAVIEKTSVSVETERDASNAPSTKTYTVVAGDCLWAIARRFYGRGSDWAKIYDANKDKISNPNLIYPGQVFVIP